MTTWNQTLPYFTEKELACKCCGLVQMDLRFAAMLPVLRQRWGKPVTVNSACRCPEHNAAVGGHPTSMHLTQNPKWSTTGTAAVDIAWRNWATMEKLTFARMAHDLEFRVGLHNGFIHLDMGRLLGINPRPFLYGEWSSPFDPEDVL
jgi:hypothetical protein